MKIQMTVAEVKHALGYRNNPAVQIEIERNPDTDPVDRMAVAIFTALYRVGAFDSFGRIIGSQKIVAIKALWDTIGRNQICLHKAKMAIEDWQNFFSYVAYAGLPYGMTDDSNDRPWRPD